MKHLKYLRYVLRHRLFVFLECCRLGVPWRGLVHDLSKFMPDEWFPYARYFYGKADASDLAIGNFDLAWLKHQHRNPHHWQFWRLRLDDGGTKLLPMPPAYACEMLADWRGAGRAQGYPSIVGWLEKSGHKIELSPQTEAALQRLMTTEERRAWVNARAHYGNNRAGR